MAYYSPERKGVIRQALATSHRLTAAELAEVKAGLTADAMVPLLRLLRGAVQALTLDNGSEFS